MEGGECSAAKSSSPSSSSSSLTQEVWAKLVPSESRYSEVEIKLNEVVISSELTFSSQEKHEWCKITRNSDQRSAIFQNLSSTTILVDEVPVDNGADVVINCGSEIVPCPDRKGYLSYRFKVMPRSEPCTRQIKVCIDAEHAKCSICLNVWHDVVTVAPCLHNFCNGCFSEWLRRSQERHANVLCPHCRAVVQFVGRNHFLHSIEEDILRADSSLSRSAEELVLLDSYASIKSNLVIQAGKKHHRKRPRPTLDEASEDIVLPCPQCGTAFGAFLCNQNTVHLQCQHCGGMMPSRVDIGVPQHCSGCDRAFCGAYWHSLGVTRSDTHSMCSFDTFKSISERTISRIPFLAHEKNRHEQDLTERCIRQMGRTLQDVISDWIVKLNNREIDSIGKRATLYFAPQKRNVVAWFEANDVMFCYFDRTRMPLNHAEMITSGTHLCNDCFDKLVSFLLYWFRISMPKNLLPPDSANRDDCWYGYTCRTQHHNEEHARRRNHVCRPTRGNGA